MRRQHFRKPYAPTLSPNSALRAIVAVASLCACSARTAPPPVDLSGTSDADELESENSAQKLSEIDSKAPSAQATSAPASASPVTDAAAPAAPGNPCLIEDSIAVCSVDLGVRNGVHTCIRGTMRCVNGTWDACLSATP